MIAPLDGIFLLMSSGQFWSGVFWNVAKSLATSLLFWRENVVHTKKQQKKITENPSKVSNGFRYIFPHLILANSVKSASVNLENSHVPVCHWLFPWNWIWKYSLLVWSLLCYCCLLIIEWSCMSMKKYSLWCGLYCVLLSSNYEWSCMSMKTWEVVSSPTVKMSDIDLTNESVIRQRVKKIYI